MQGNSYHTTTINDVIAYRLKTFRLYIDRHDLMDAITIIGHPKDDPIHQKYRLLGQEYFRSKAAELLLKYKGGSGKELQVFLGDALSKSRKQAFFKRYLLFKYCSFDPQHIDIDNYAHQLVNSFLGYISVHADEKDLNRFILFYWLDEVWSKEIDPTIDWEHMKSYAKQKGYNLRKTITKKENDKESYYIGELWNGNDRLLSCRGNSYRYTHKKLIRSTVRFL